MGRLDEALILDTKYAYDVAVEKARWREEYSRWEEEKAYRERKYEIDVAYRLAQIEYDKAREQRRYDHDVDVAYATVSAKRAEAVGVDVVSRRERMEAEFAAATERQKTATTLAQAKVNAAAFGSGRSTLRLMNQLGAEGAERLAKLDLMAEVQAAVREQQKYQMGVDAVNAVQTVTPYLEPLAPKEVVKQVEYAPPIFVKPLEPNLEGFEPGVTEDDYIMASPGDLTQAYVEGRLPTDREGDVDREIDTDNPIYRTPESLLPQPGDMTRERYTRLKEQMGTLGTGLTNEERAEFRRLQSVFDEEYSPK